MALLAACLTRFVLVVACIAAVFRAAATVTSSILREVGENGSAFPDIGAQGTWLVARVVSTRFVFVLIPLLLLLVGFVLLLRLLDGGSLLGRLRNFAVCCSPNLPIVDEIL